MKLLHRISITLVCVTALSACQQQFVLGPSQPTEASLVAQSYKNGLSTELNIHYEQAYRNLKTAYSRCMAFTSERGFVFTDSKLEPDFEMATLFIRSKGGVYLSKATIESIGKERARFTLYLPEEYKFAQARFNQDIKRILGEDKQCNVGITTSTVTVK